MRIDCIGGGSVGLLLSARLCASGAAVKVITRTEKQAECLRTLGITVLKADGQADVQTVIPEAASFADYASLDNGYPDWIFLTVKQKDIDEELLEAIKLHMGPESRFCCFQNGLGHLDKLRKAVVTGELYAAVTTEGARRSGLSEVVHTGRGITRFGAPGQIESRELQTSLQMLVECFQKAGFTAEMSKLIDIEIWNKLIINSVINPLTALLGITNGNLLKSEDALHLMRELYDEAAGLAERLGIPVSEDLWERILAVCEATGPNRSSMLQDLEAGRLTELEWLNGSLLHEAERMGMKLPSHRLVYHLVRCRSRLGSPGHLEG